MVARRRLREGAGCSTGSSSSVSVEAPARWGVPAATFNPFTSVARRTWALRPVLLRPHTVLLAFLAVPPRPLRPGAVPARPEYTRPRHSSRMPPAAAIDPGSARHPATPSPRRAARYRVG